jgi:hypothetical protein
MTREERAKLIAKYKDGYKQIVHAIEGITELELDFRRERGKWTCREIIHHLADSEMTAAIRIRRLLVEFQPFIGGYDQDEFARKLQYSRRPIEPALKAIEGARTTTSQLLDLMSEEEWSRSGEHSESGSYSCDIWLGIYAAHAHNHADQIRRNRAAYKESIG